MIDYPYSMIHGEGGGGEGGGEGDVRKETTAETPYLVTPVHFGRGRTPGPLSRFLFRGDLDSLASAVAAEQGV